MPDEFKLTVVIRNEAPVALFDFTNGFLCLADEYGRYIRTQDPMTVSRDASLYVREIRPGSIIVDLVALAPFALPFVEHANSILRFAEYLKMIYDHLLGRKVDKPVLKKKSYENVAGIVEPVAKDSAAQINFQTFINGDVHQHFNMNSIETNAVQNAARREIAALQEPITGTQRNVLLYFFQVRDDPASAVGDRGIIESIHSFPVKVRFQGEEIKNRVLHAVENPFLYAYLVDVSVETIEGRPILYNVTAVHESIERPQSA